MAAVNAKKLSDEELANAVGGTGEAGRKQYPDWVNTIAKMVGNSTYTVFDKDGGHGVYLDMVRRFGPLNYNVLLVPEEFRY